MKRLISLGIFVFMTIIVWWSITKNYNEENPIQPPQTAHYIEMFMNEFKMTVMDETGKPNYTMKGIYLKRYNDSDNSEVDQPLLQLLQEGNQWVVSAETALINDKNETIQLNTNVVMQQENIEPAITIRTQNMLIHTKTQIAQTEALVEITQGESYVKSHGMIYNNITSDLELSSRVNGYYMPYD